MPIWSPDYINGAKCLQFATANSHIANPHECRTVVEVLYSTYEKVDVISARAGTGGTITGLSRSLKKHNVNVLLISIDPMGYILAAPVTLKAVAFSRQSHE